MDLVCRIRGGLDFAGLGPKPGDDVPNGPPLLELGDHQGSILRVFPNPKVAALRPHRTLVDLCKDRLRTTLSHRS